VVASLNCKVNKKPQFSHFHSLFNATPLNQKRGGSSNERKKPLLQRMNATRKREWEGGRWMMVEVGKRPRQGKANFHGK
jgi:hypothetical protein